MKNKLFLTAILLVFTIFLIGFVSAPCSGTPGSCYDHYEEYVCEMCGCFWKPYTCSGTASVCSVHTNQYNCQDCGCLWTAPAPENFYINVADSWRLATDVYINIGDTWQDVEAVYVNVGDVWRLVYSI